MLMQHQRGGAIRRRGFRHSPTGLCRHATGSVVVINGTFCATPQKTQFCFQKGALWECTPCDPKFTIPSGIWGLGTSFSGLALLCDWPILLRVWPFLLNVGPSF